MTQTGSTAESATSSNSSQLLLRWKFCFLLSLIPCGLTFLTFLAEWHWSIDLLTSFHCQYAIALSLFIAIFLLARKWELVVFPAIALAYNGFLLAPYYTPIKSGKAAEADLRIVVANVWSANRNHDALIKFIQENSPDIILLLEVNADWSNALEVLDLDYPHSVLWPRPDNFGMALLSRWPLSESEVKTYENQSIPSILSKVTLDHGQRISLLGIHPLPPVGQKNATLRNELLRDAAMQSAEVSGPRILLGDLNVSPWSPHFEQLLENSHTSDSRLGHGIQPTWPTGNILLRVPLDHALVSEHFQVVSHSIGPDIGSDHLPVMVDLALSNLVSEQTTR